jgi:hypothetical protein
MLRRARHADFAKLLPIYHKAHRAQSMTQLRTPHLFICDFSDRTDWVIN